LSINQRELTGNTQYDLNHHCTDVTRAGLMLSLMSIGRELGKALDVGLGLGRCLHLFCELRFQSHLST